MINIAWFAVKWVMCYVSHDLPKVSNSNARILLYADDTSVIVSNPSLPDFKLNMKTAIVDINRWFKTNTLSLNLKKNSVFTI
jgi:hypothetical protein